MKLSPTLAVIALGALLASTGAAADLTLNKGDHVCYIGNTLADRMQHFGWLETMIQSRFAGHELVFRNLGFSADEINKRPRSANFGDPDSLAALLEYYPGSALPQERRAIERVYGR